MVHSSQSENQVPKLSVGDLSYSIRRYYVDAFYHREILDIAADSLVLDLGGTKVRKRGLFDVDAYPFQVIYANLVPDKRPDVVCDASTTPFSENSFDAVICAELLEHVRDPRRVLLEVSRILRPGGKLIASVPFLFPIHGDPEDYGRYTDHFWQMELEGCGFSNIVLVKQGAWHGVLAEMIRARLYDAHKRGRISQRWQKAITRRLVAAMKSWAIRHDAKEKENSFFSSYTTGFGIKADKCKQG